MLGTEQVSSSILHSNHGQSFQGDFVHRGIEVIAAKSPNAVALVCQDKSITYKGLNERANQLAWHLIEVGISAKQPVAIMMERNFNCIIALLACLKIGSYYVPIETNLPSERIAFIIKKAAIDTVVIDDENIKLEGCKQVNVNDNIFANYSSENISAKITLNDPAYCIYTSGSTGEPKGVLISHKGFANYCEWAKNQYVKRGVNNFAFYSSLTFDLTVTSIFVPLISGCTVFIYGEPQRDLPVIDLVLNDNQVDFLKLTPSHLMLIKNRDFTNSKLKVLVVGGEPFKRSLAVEINRKFNQKIAIYNEYGPTETVVGCTYHLFNSNQDTYSSVPIGRPIANTSIYLFDDNQQPVEKGEIGQIYIAGAGVAIGYNNQDMLTQQSFLTTSIDSYSRLYASGDFAMINHRGDLIYLGRKDSQVKVRGYRVELGDVEHTLLTHPKIKDSIVLPNSFFYDESSKKKQSLYCVKCGISENFPGISFSKEGVCQHCVNFATKQHVVDAYFGSLKQLHGIFNRAQQAKHPQYDCIVALSGGKDSVYALCRIVEMGMRVLAFTFDNGYISDGAKRNIERTIMTLGIDHRYVTTEYTKPIFLDSLKRYSDVCHGCFKAIYTFAIDLAQELNINCIVTGLSRGQLFETRISEILRSDEFNEEVFEKNIIDGRKIYHRVADPVRHLLRPSWIHDEQLFNSIQFIDFYRYCDVTRSEIYQYITEKVAWVKPADTGKSSNCRLNDVAIYVHGKERGYHKYALPHSWEVRTGHISRQEAISELEKIDSIDEQEVQLILNELGYKLEQSIDTENTELIAYYLAGEELSDRMLRTYLSNHLPSYMIPICFIRLDSLPLTPSGKINRKALPKPVKQTNIAKIQQSKPPTQLIESLVQIWKEVLMLSDIGVSDNFFEIGGHSLSAVMLLFKIDQNFNKLISLEDFSKMPTIESLAELIAKEMP